jgi:hypothetical protein
MIAWPCGDTLPSGRICRGLRVGRWTVAAVFERPPAWCDAPSAEAGRLAEDLVAATLGVPGGDVRVAALPPTGRPVARVAGREQDPFVSVSHVRRLLGAAVSTDARVGLDIVDPADAGRGLDAFFSPDELALVPDDVGLLRALLWAAKEAAYKAARLDAEFRPRAVTIDGLTANGFTWIVRGRHALVEGAGRFATVGRHVVAIAATAAAVGHVRHEGHATSTGQEAVACS